MNLPRPQRPPYAMRMFAITVAGVPFASEPSRGRTPEELQHRLTHEEGLKWVRVREWIAGGASATERTTEDTE